MAGISDLMTLPANIEFPGALALPDTNFLRFRYIDQRGATTTVAPQTNSATITSHHATATITPHRHAATITAHHTSANIAKHDLRGS